MLAFTIVLLSLITLSRTFQGNDQIGVPMVECGPEQIGVTLEVDQPLEGTIYLQNWRHKSGCHSERIVKDNLVGANSSTFSLSLPLTSLASCGLGFSRHTPSGDLVVRGVWIVSFHPLFLTKADRAYDVQCIFKQRDLSSTFEITVSNLKPVVIRRTLAVPDVEMKIVSGHRADPNLPKLASSTVGHPITFLWHILPGAEHVKFRVKECTAESADGTVVELVKNSCKKETVMITDVVHDDEKQIAYAKSTAFRFASDGKMWFRCKVTFCSQVNHHDAETNDEICAYSSCATAKRSKRNVAMKSEENEIGLYFNVKEAYNQLPLAETLSNKVAKFNLDNGKTMDEQPYRVCLKKEIYATTFMTTTIAILFSLTVITKSLLSFVVKKGF